MVFKTTEELRAIMEAARKEREAERIQRQKENLQAFLDKHVPAVCEAAEVAATRGDNSVELVVYDLEFLDEMLTYLRETIGYNVVKSRRDSLSGRFDTVITIEWASE